MLKLPPKTSEKLTQPRIQRMEKYWQIVSQSRKIQNKLHSSYRFQSNNHAKHQKFIVQRIHLLECCFLSRKLTVLLLGRCLPRARAEQNLIRTPIPKNVNVSELDSEGKVVRAGVATKIRQEQFHIYLSSPHEWNPKDASFELLANQLIAPHILASDKALERVRQEKQKLRNIRNLRRRNQNLIPTTHRLEKSKKSLQTTMLMKVSLLFKTWNGSRFTTRSF